MIDLRGQTAIVTGAAGGLGRAYAMGLARRGASVVVNDVGGSLSGEGSAADPAEQVAAEIRAAGGQAVTDRNSVATEAGARALIAHAIDEFGAVHAVVCNAGISRHAPFDSFSLDEFRRIVDVHLYGTAGVLHAAWPHFRAQGYGRVVVTASAAAFWGVQEVTPYGAGKGAVFGLARCLAHEGAPLGIRVNIISPAAKTRMSAHLFGADGGWTWRPELVEPLVTYLASRECSHNGAVFAAMHGNFARIEPMQAIGLAVDPRHDVSAEAIVEGLAVIDDLTGARTIAHGRDAGGLSVKAQLASGLYRAGEGSG